MSNTTRGLNPTVVTSLIKLSSIVTRVWYVAHEYVVRKIGPFCGHAFCAVLEKTFAIDGLFQSLQYPSIVGRG